MLSQPPQHRSRSLWDGFNNSGDAWTSGGLSVSVAYVFFSFSFPLSVIGADAGNGIRVFIPDIGMFVAGLVIWLLCRSLVQKRPPEDMAQYNADFEPEEQVSWFFSIIILPLLDTRLVCLLDLFQPCLV